MITAYNVLFLVTIFLNAACAYALVLRITREWLPSVFGAVVFAGSPFVGAHMNGHFNLLSAWTLPLVALAAMEMSKGRAAGRWWPVPVRCDGLSRLLLHRLTLSRSLADYWLAVPPGEVTFCRPPRDREPGRRLAPWL